MAGTPPPWLALPGGKALLLMRESGRGDLLGLVHRTGSDLVRQLHRGQGHVASVELGRQGLDHLAVLLQTALDDGRLQGVAGERQAAGAQVGHARQARDLDLLAGGALDVAESPLLARLGDGEGHAFAPGAADCARCGGRRIPGRRAGRS